MARPYIVAAHGAAGVGRVQGGGGEAHGAAGVGRVHGGGGEAEIPGWRWAGWRGRTMARPYSVAVCKAAAVRRTGLLAWGGCMVF